MAKKNLSEVIEFTWDKGNIDKNFIKHNVTNEESEEVFFDKKKVTFVDQLHSSTEERFILIGRTKKERLLFIVFTRRGNRIRIISGRDTNKREKRFYEKRT